MTSAVIKWIANGMISLVVAGTLWMAHTVQPSEHGLMSMLVAEAVASPESAASAPTVKR
jgi:hypothetical protein